MKKLTILIVFMVFSTLSFGQLKFSLLNQGKEYLDKGEYDLAIQKFDRVLDIDIRSAPAFFYKGKAYMEGKKEYDLAIENFTKALKNDSFYIDAYTYRAATYQKINQPEKAEKDIKNREKIMALSEIEAVTVQENEPDKTKARKYFLKANGYALKYIYDLAVQEYTNALEFFPDNPVIYCHRGEAYLELQEYDLAIQDFNKAIELRPKDFSHYSLYPNLNGGDDFFGWFDESHPKRLIGQAYYNKKAYDLAIAQFDKLLENSKSGELYIGRGNAYLEKKEYDLAIADFTNVIEQAPKMYGNYVYRAMAYEQKGEVEKAVADWRKHHELLFRKTLAESISQ